MSETIGERLKRAREERRLTIQQVAEFTRLRPHYVEALERGDLSAIPSTAQARGFLRIYADFLGLKPEELIPAAQPSPQTPASAPDLSTAPPKAAASQPRPGLLARLRERFGRGSNHLAEISKPGTPGTKSAVEPRPAGLEPEPFVPVRSKEELPAESVPLAEEPAALDEPGATTSSPKAKRPSGRKIAGKSASKSRSGGETDVKKNIS